MEQGLVRLLYNFGKRFMGWTLHMIMCVLLCYPVSIRIHYQQGVLFLVCYCTHKQYLRCWASAEVCDLLVLFFR